MKRLAGKPKERRQQQQQQLGFTGHSVEVGVNQAVITVTFRHSNTDAQAGERLAQTLATLAAAVETARIQLQSERRRGNERPRPRTRPVTLGTYTNRPSGYAGQYVVVKQDVIVSPPWDTDIVKEALLKVLAPHWVLDRSVYSADLEIVVQYASQSVM